jgi:peptidoglycan/xylan/chitin deacetylase (PgdA/CDA1 family)
MSKLATFWRNPFVTVVPVVLLLLFVWQQYSVIAASPALASAATNILPNAGLEELDGQGFPIGWQVSKTPSSSSSTREGYQSSTAIALTNNDATMRGNTTLTSPLATVMPGERYYYKTLYKSNVPFALILRTNYTDGSYKQSIVGRFDQAEAWESGSSVFSADRNVQSVQFIYSVAGKGELQIDRTYLEPNPQDIYQQPELPSGPNVLPNQNFESADGVVADNWSSFSYGDNRPTFTYESKDSQRYLHAQLDAYKNGEAKWQYAPIAVSAHQQYRFSAMYRSDVPVEVVAEYTTGSTGRKFETLQQLLPAKDWTQFDQLFEVPESADSVMVTLVLKSGGYVDMHSPGLYSQTLPGPMTWDRPRLSLTFDDGWLSSFTSGAALLNKYGYEGTFYLNPSTIDTTNFVSSAQVQNLRDNGHQIASHGYKHFNYTTLDRSVIDYQLSYAAKYFNQVHGLTSIDFAAPYGGNDAQLAYYAHKYYSSLRGTDPGVNTRQNFNPYNIKVLYMGHSVTREHLMDEIAKAKASNGWLVIVYHRIEPSSNSEIVVTSSQFEQQLDAIKSSGVLVEPVSAALQEIENQ